MCVLFAHYKNINNSYNNFHKLHYVFAIYLDQYCNTDVTSMTEKIFRAA